MNSLRKITGLALACLAPAFAMAQADAPKASVTVYGTLNVNLQSTEASGAATATQNVKSRLAVSVDSSNVGVRAALKLSDMIGGVAQCESSANVDGIGAAGICGRNSRVGLTGDWGTLFYGNWDTPYKTAAYGTKADDPFGNTDVYDAAGIISSPGFNTTTGAYSTQSDTTITRFVIRAQNSVAYHTPTWMGLSAKAQYSVDEFKNAAGFQNPELYSAGINYDTGKMLPVGCSVFGAWEQHKDGFGVAGIGAANRFAAGAVATDKGSLATPRHTTDTGLRFGAGCEYKMEALTITVGGVYEMLSYEQTNPVANSLKKYERNAWQAGGKVRFGQHELRARYSAADKGKATITGLTTSTADYGATMLALGYAYNFTDQLSAYLYYAQITNERNAQYTFGTAGVYGAGTASATSAGSVPVGADPSAFGLGARFAF